MSAHVRFKATDDQTRQMAALAVEAATGERVEDLSLITDPMFVRVWRNKLVAWFCTETFGVKRLLHCNRRPYNRRPWFKAYPTALSIVEAVEGVEVIEALEWDEYCTSARRVYSRNFFRCRTKKNSWQRTMGEELAELLKPRSIVDLGCGLGAVIHGARDAGVERVEGYDLAYENAAEYVDPGIADAVREGDAGAPMSRVRPADVALSVEVAEHLPPASSEAFADNLARLAGRWAVLTAAPPGQVGRGHVNLRPKAFWVELLEARGLRLMPQVTEELAKRWAPHAPDYVTRNLMVFRKEIAACERS